MTDWSVTIWNSIGLRGILNAIQFDAGIVAEPAQFRWSALVAMDVDAFGIRAILLHDQCEVHIVARLQIGEFTIIQNGVGHRHRFHVPGNSCPGGIETEVLPVNIQNNSRDRVTCGGSETDGGQKPSSIPVALCPITASGSLTTSVS